MGKLQAALDWAARGFRIFPLPENAKEPPEVPFVTAATTDPEQIRQWWTDVVTGLERDRNIGCLTTGHIVLDVDVKKGRRGLETFSRLGLEFDTLTCRTASGGYHLIYAGDAGQSPIESRESGIDVRSRNGYIVAPGSTIDGRPYSICIDEPIASFPEHLRPYLKPVRERTQNGSVLVELDRPENISIATHYLQRDAPNALEGSRSHTCYTVAAKLRDMGVSEAVAGELLLENWNERNAPPMDVEELAATVEHAYRYAKGQAGALAPAVTFQAVTVLPAPQLPAVLEHVNGTPYRFGNMLDAEKIKPRPWIMGSILMRGIITTVVGGGGAGKSILILIIAAHLACGKAFLGHQPIQAGKSIIYNAEDDLEEASRRLNAICTAYNLDRETVRNSVALVDSDMIGLKLVSDRPPKINEAHVAELIKVAGEPDVLLIGLDPLGELHSANENDNPEMTYVMTIFRHVARRTQTAMLVNQHTGKPLPAAKGSLAGEMSAGRGASAIPFAARVVLTLFPISDTDCETIGVLPRERKNYVRLDGAKANNSPPGAPPKWLRWAEKKLPNGDYVGVLMEHNVQAAVQSYSESIGDALFEEMRDRGTGMLTMEDAMRVWRRTDSLVSREPDMVVRRRIERTFAQKVVAQEGTLVMQKKGNQRVIVMEF